jgi:tripartite ATP-independent transporter DctP family solute receptor
MRKESECLVLTALCIAVMFPAIALGGQKAHLRVGIGSASDSALVHGVRRMAQLVEEYSEGEITMEPFPDSVLGGDRDMIEGVSLGTIEMCNVATGPVGNFSDKFFVLDLPYIVTDRELAHRVLDGEIGREILDSLHPAGIHVLSFWELGYRQLYATKRIIRKPDDVKGMKLRVMENDVHIALWNGLGAYATPMSISEVFTALQQGTIDGHDNPIGSTYIGKYYEADPNCSLTYHVYSPTVNMINKTLYDSLTNKQKAALMRADTEARAYERGLIVKEDEGAIEGWQKAGGTVTEVDVKEWQQAASFMLDLFKDRIDMKVVKAMRGE